MFLNLTLLCLYIFTLFYAVQAVKYFSPVRGYHSLFYCFLFAQSLYVITPMFDNIVGTVEYKFINELVLYSIISTIFLSLGGFAFSYKYKDNTNPIAPNIYIEKFKNYEGANKILFYSLVVGFTSACLYLFALYQVLGLDPVKWFSAYLRFETGEDSGNFGKEQAWLMGAISTPAILIYLLKDKNIVFSSTFLIPFTIVIFSLLVRGNRNYLMLVLMPIIVIYLIKKGYLNTNFVILFFLVFIFSGQLIDILRAAGLYSVFTGEQINPAVWSMGLSVGEFGSTIRSFEFYLSNGFKFDLLLGKSYLLDTILNMATTLGFPFEVLSYKLAVAMSARGQLFGFGFSHQLESILNFGFIGGPLVYFFFGFFLKYIDSIKTENIFTFILSIYLLPIIINFQRIDFAVAVKIAAIPIFFLMLIIGLSRIKL